MIPTASALRSLTPMVARSTAQVGLRAGTIPRPQSMRLSQVGLGARRWNTEENKGGRAKLIFRFGLKDIPVELYPMAFVVAAACVGAAFAVGRHFYVDGLRLGPTRKDKEAAGH